MKPARVLTISLDQPKQCRQVGRLAIRERQIYFEYDADFIASGLNLSPFHLPLKSDVQQGEVGLFDGLPGVFDDSLPDGWGRSLLDRQLRRQDIDPGTLTPLDRLTYVGRRGMGALVYEPDYSSVTEQDQWNLDRLAEASAKTLTGDADVLIDALLALNGSSSGARPKVMVGVSQDRQTIVTGVDTLPTGFEHWLVKFPAALDRKDIGAVEYAYSRMAQRAGLEVMPTHLFPAKRGAGYFAVQRFDRRGNERTHMHTACGLLNADFRLPSLDYKDLLAAAWLLTKDQREVEKLYRLAVFNVMAHNRDDHSKNFSFLMDEQGQWRVSPVYDLTFSSGPGGEHSTTIMGEGRTPQRSHLLELAKAVSLKPAHAAELIEQVIEAVKLWPTLAEEAGVSKTTRQQIGKSYRAI